MSFVALLTSGVVQGSGIGPPFLT